MGSRHQGKRLPQYLVGGWERGKRGDPYTEEIKVDADLYRKTGVIYLLDPHIMCVFDISNVAIDTASYDGRHPHKILSLNDRHKKRKYLEAFLERRHHFTMCVFSVRGVMVEDTKSSTKKLADDL